MNAAQQPLAPAAPQFWVAVVSPARSHWFHGPLSLPQAQAYLANVQAAGNSAALVPALSN